MLGAVFESGVFGDRLHQVLSQREGHTCRGQRLRCGAAGQCAPRVDAAADRVPRQRSEEKAGDVRTRHFTFSKPVTDVDCVCVVTTDCFLGISTNCQASCLPMT